MKLTVRAKVHVDRPPAEAFDAAADYRSWPRIITKVAMIPGVVSAEMLNGAQPGPGARRRIGLTDGTTVEEQIDVFDRGVEHRYHWVNPPAPPLSLVLRSGEARWLFQRSGNGSDVSWSYDLGVSSPLAYPMARLVGHFFERWMAQSLQNLKSSLAQ